MWRSRGKDWCDLSKSLPRDPLILWRLESPTGAGASCAVEQSSGLFTITIVVEDAECVVEQHRSSLSMLESSLAYAESLLSRGWHES